MPSEEEAAKLVQDAKEMCKRGQTVYKRGILSTVSSTFNPLVFVAPFLIEGKKILQELCKEDTGWDDPIPVAIKMGEIEDRPASVATIF